MWTVKIDKRRLVVGVSGASGAAQAAEVHLVYTKVAVLVLRQELGRGPELWFSLADWAYHNEDMRPDYPAG